MGRRWGQGGVWSRRSGLAAFLGLNSWRCTFSQRNSSFSGAAPTAWAGEVHSAIGEEHVHVWGAGLVSTHLPTCLGAGERAVGCWLLVLQGWQWPGI